MQKKCKKNQFFFVNLVRNEHFKAILNVGFFMRKFEFKIAEAYSLYSGVTIGWQKGAAIMFLMERILKDDVKILLQEAFTRYVHFVRGREDCTQEFRGEIKVMFLYAPRINVRKFLFRRKRFTENGNAIGF